MHDVMRELGLTIGCEENFCNVFDEEKETQNNQARRLSIYNSTVSIQSSACHLRSLMLFETEIPPLAFRSIAEKIKLLRVLDLQNSSIKSMPDELVELFNLRYLSLRDTSVEELPKTIGRCCNLQTLDIRNSKIKTLPKEVENLKKLRHLYTYFYTSFGDFDFYDFAQAPAGICNLKDLQTLQCIGANDEIVRKVGSLTQLKRLTVAKVKRVHGAELCCASLPKLKSLLMLQVKATTGEEILDLDALAYPPIHLENLSLSGRLERLPPWISSLQDLTKVSLRWSQLNDDPLSSLQALPNLMRLRLIKAYQGQELCIRRRSFSKLKQLFIIGLPQLDRINIEEESMSCIEGIHLIRCPELKSLPKGIQYLTSLQELYLQDMSKELIANIWGGEGRNLQHIPYAGHFDTTTGVYERLSNPFIKSYR